MVLLTPGVAQAATVDGSAPGAPVFNAAPGETNDLEVTQTGTDVTFHDDSAPITATTRAGCTLTAGDVTCAGGDFDAIEIHLGDGDDSTTFTGVTLGVTQFGDAEADVLRGPSGTLSSDGGTGDDILDASTGTFAFSTLDGAAGDDALNGGLGGSLVTMRGGSGADDLFGGSGSDTADYSDRVAGVHVSLEGTADDGESGEGDNVHGSIESIIGGAGDDTLDATAGDVALIGGSGNDTLLARDGFADLADCGLGGADRAVIDQLDVVTASCETVESAAVTSPAAPNNPVPAAAGDDRPPAVAFKDLRTGAAIPAAPISIAFTVSDDVGIKGVELKDDGRTVGVSTTPPYSIRYEPTAGDIGSNTLTVTATDSAGQTSGDLAEVRVGRFAPTHFAVKATKQGARRIRVNGTLTVPATVGKTRGCRGTVTLKARRTGKVLTTKQAKLSSACTFAATLSATTAKGVTVEARYNGSPSLLSITKTVRP